jgi:hypothetical protein
MFSRAWLSRNKTHLVDIQQNAPIPSRTLTASDPLPDLDDDAEFLAKLASECLLGILSGLYLAAGKLPLESQIHCLPALRDEAA